MSVNRVCVNLDEKALDRLELLTTHFHRLTGLPAGRSAVVRRAIEVLVQQEQLPPRQ